jgi:hypothetical protein
MLSSLALRHHITRSACPCFSCCPVQLCTPLGRPAWQTKAVPEDALKIGLLRSMTKPEAEFGLNIDFREHSLLINPSARIAPGDVVSVHVCKVRQWRITFLLLKHGRLSHKVSYSCRQACGEHQYHMS